MFDLPSILPANAQRTELSLEQLPARVLPSGKEIAKLWDAQTCPAHLLAWLAWALSVDDWDPDWPEGTKRSVIATSIGIHRKKGTLSAVAEAIREVGYGEAVILEGFSGQFFDGSVPRDGTQTRGTPDHWAEYRVILRRPISQDQANTLRRILENIAPARAHLKELDFVQASNLYDGMVPRDGTFTRGVT